MDEAITMDDVESVPQPLGPRIRIAREHAQMSLEEAARRLGVRADTFAGWEADRELPRANRLVMLAGLLNVTLPFLLEGRADRHMEEEESLETLRSQVHSVRLRMGEAIDALEDLERRFDALIQDHASRTD